MEPSPKRILVVVVARWAVELTREVIPIEILRESWQIYRNTYTIITIVLLYYYYTRVDPCIKCTRSKLSTAQVAAAFVDPTDLLYVCGTV